LSAPLLPSYAEDVEELIVAWLSPLRRTGSARLEGDPLPFTLVNGLPGTEDPNVGLAAPVVQVETLCARTLGWAAAKNESNLTHRRMTLLARSCDCGGIILSDGLQAAIDYVTVDNSPSWLDYEDVMILRKVARYTIGLSYVGPPT
jgi:hypothetical protein